MTGYDATAATLRGASYLIPVDNVAALIRHAVEAPRAGPEGRRRVRPGVAPRTAAPGPARRRPAPVGHRPRPAPGRRRLVAGGALRHRPLRHGRDDPARGARGRAAAPVLDARRSRLRALRDGARPPRRVPPRARRRAPQARRPRLPEGVSRPPRPGADRGAVRRARPGRDRGPIPPPRPGAPNAGGGYLDAVEELAWTAGIVARYGWRSVAKADADHTATASRLAFLMHPPNPEAPGAVGGRAGGVRAGRRPLRATARKTVELVRAAPPDSEYLVKLKAIAEAPAVHVRDRALWCSAITLHIRWRAKELERRAVAPRRPSRPAARSSRGASSSSTSAPTATSAARS